MSVARSAAVRPHHPSRAPAYTPHNDHAPSEGAKLDASDSAGTPLFLQRAADPQAATPAADSAEGADASGAGGDPEASSATAPEEAGAAGEAAGAAGEAGAAGGAEPREGGGEAGDATEAAAEGGASESGAGGAEAEGAGEGESAGGGESGGGGEAAAGAVPAVQLACACGGTCGSCRAAANAFDGRRSIIQGAGGGDRSRWPAPSDVQSSLGPGTPLPPLLAARFSSSFGRDFSDVRLHSSTPKASELGAHAFTVGNHVGFAPGLFRPGTPGGDRLIAHELTHVVQQSGGKGQVQAAGAGHDHYEREADRTAETVTSGGRVDNVTPVGGQPVQRENAVTRFLGSVAAAGADFAADQFWNLVREFFPSLEPYLRNPARLWSDIVAAIGRGLGELAGSILGPLRGLDPIGALRSAFGPLVRGVQSLIVDQDSRPFFTAVGDMIGKLRSFSAPVLRLATGLFDRIKGLLQRAMSSIAKPVWDLFRRVGGVAYDVISGIGEQLAGLVRRVRAWGERAWNWLKGVLGFGGDGGSSRGIWDWIKEKAAAAWEAAKATVAPWIEPLKRVAAVLLTLSPFGPLIVAFQYGPRIIRALTQLWQNLRVTERVAQARQALAAILPQIVAFMRQAGQVLVGVAAAVAGVLDRVVTAVDSLTSAFVRGSLAVLATALRWVTDKLRLGVAWFQGELASGFTQTRAFLAAVGHFAELVLGVVVKLVMIAANPLMLPVMLASELWQRLPDDFKRPILNWLLNLMITVLRRLPNNPVLGPLAAIFKHVLIGFLERVRDGGDGDEKIRISDRIARLLQGSVAFVGGLLAGVATGVWEGLIMPFELVYHLFTAIPAIVNFIETLPDRIAGVLRGIGAQIQSAANWVVTNIWGTLRGFFSTPGGGFLSTLSSIWDAITSGAESVGGSVAGALIGFIMLDDYPLGSKLGWVAGTVLFDAVLGFLTGGVAVLLQSASVPLQILGRLLRVVVRAQEIMNQVFGAILHAVGPIFRGLGRMLQRFPAMAALERRIMSILESLGALTERATVAGEEFAGRFAGTEARVAAQTEREAAAAARAAEAARRGGGAGGEAPAPHEPAPAPEAAPAAHEPAPTPHEGSPAPAERQPDLESPAAREQHVQETGQVDTPQLTGADIEAELAHIRDNPHLIEGTPPNRSTTIGKHEWREGPGNTWCRHSSPVGGACTIDPLGEGTATTAAAERARVSESEARDGVAGGSPESPTVTESAPPSEPAASSQRAEQGEAATQAEASSRPRPEEFLSPEDVRRYNDYLHRQARKGNTNPLEPTEWYERFGHRPGPNPGGQGGNQSHRDTVEQLANKAREEFPDGLIRRGRSIKGKTGINRRPDVWVMDETGRVLKVYEAARTLPGGQFVERELEKMREYQAAGIPWEFADAGPYRTKR
jgi:hypothetical protein